MTASASLTRERAAPAELTLLVRCPDECRVLKAFDARLMAIIERLPITTEVLYVNARAQGPVTDWLDQMAQDLRVSTLHLSPTTDKESLLRAGLHCARGRAVIVLDGDLRDPPELIPLMVQEWRKGFEIVNMQRRTRPRGSWLKRTGARLYDALIDQLIDDFEVPANVGDFRLIGPQALAAIRAMDDNIGALNLQISWLGYRSTEVNYDRKPHQAGRPTCSPMAWVQRCTDGIFAFSLRPIRLYSYVSAISFVGGTLWVAGSAMFGALTHQHLLTQSILLLCLGTALVGEYIASLLKMTRPRPNDLRKSPQSPIKG